jgi:A/G-specific adenine glycosylase
VSRAVTVAAQVIAWQRRHGRHDLPWQASRDPYRVWLSEVMLQQTQVATVLAYYERFLQRFPDVATLAAAPADDVLAHWSGLGYYGRARNLHRCAQVVVAEHGGAFPRTSAQLATLPGIGRSTAAAIAAFCFGERAAILDGNVKRVLTRVLGFEQDLTSAAGERALWAEAEALLPPARDITAYTQGLMDLGAGVCTLRRPQCGACPLAATCVARRDGDAQRYPVRTRRLVRGERANVLLWLAAGPQVWLQRRPATGVWAGLWSLPEFADLDDLGRVLHGWPGQGHALPAFSHALTHFDWRLQPWRHELPHAASSPLPDGRWWPIDEALQLGLPAPVRRLLATASADDTLAAQELVDELQA